MIRVAIDVMDDAGSLQCELGDKNYQHVRDMVRRARLESHEFIGKEYIILVYSWCGLEGDLTRDMARRVAIEFVRQHKAGKLHWVDLSR